LWNRIIAYYAKGAVLKVKQYLKLLMMPLNQHYLNSEASKCMPFAFLQKNVNPPHPIKSIKTLMNKGRGGEGLGKA